MRNVGLALCGVIVAAAGCNAQGSPPGLPSREEAAFISQVTTFLEEGGDIGGLYSDGYTALGKAAFDGYIHATRFLLAKGAPVNAKDKFGLTPLDRAANAGEEEVVELLLAAGADPNLSGPLVSAASGGNASIVKLLLAHHADPNQPVEVGSALGFASEQGHLEVVRLLLDAGADPNKLSPRASFTGWLPVELAAWEGHLDVVKLLLARGARMTVNTAAAIGDLAFVRGHLDMAQIRAPEKTNDPMALHFAAANGQWGVTAYLLSQGADINAKGWTFTALDLAAERGRLDTMRLLLACRPKDAGEAIGWAAFGCQPKAAELLLDWSVKPDSKGAKHALCTAAEEGYLPVVEVLVQRGVDVNCADEYGGTPLHLCVLQGFGGIIGTPSGPQEHLAVAEYLLGKGAAVNAKDVNGDTPLDNVRWAAGYAKGLPHQEMTRLLRKHGAKTAAELAKTADNGSPAGPPF